MSAPKMAYSIETFAEAHEIGITKTREEISSGRLKARRCGGRVVITTEDAATWRDSLPDSSLASSAAA
jgi:hypothetical protein